MRRVALSALVLIAVCVLFAGSAVASDLDALWMSLTPGGPAQTDFPSGTETVYVVFEYTDFVFENVRVVVSDYRGTVIFRTTQTFVGSGTASIPASAGQTIFPDGPYVTTLYYAGQYLTRAVEWTVGGVDSPPTPTAFPPARLEVEPAALTFSGAQGGPNPASQRVLITNNTASPSIWRATASAPWVELSPAEGGTPALLRVGVDGTGLPAGSYSARVTITADGTDGIEGSPQVVDVAFRLSPPGGTSTLNLPAVVAGTGWTVSDEVTGNHFGEGEIRAGDQAGRRHLGGLQFGVAAIPDASNICAAAVVLAGLRWEKQPSTGDWVLELLDGSMVDGWTDRSYADLASAAARVALVPAHGVVSLGPGVENVWYLDTAGLSVLQSLVRDDDFVVLRLRYRPSGSGSAAEDGLFVWDAAGIFRVNFEPGAGATATPIATATSTVTLPTRTPTMAPPTATPGTPPPPPPPPGGKSQPGNTPAGLVGTLVLLGAAGVAVLRVTKA